MKERKWSRRVLSPIRLRLTRIPPCVRTTLRATGS